MIKDQLAIFFALASMPNFTISLNFRYAHLIKQFCLFLLNHIKNNKIIHNQLKNLNKVE